MRTNRLRLSPRAVAAALAAALGGAPLTALRAPSAQAAITRRPAQPPPDAARGSTSSRPDSARALAGVYYGTELRSPLNFRTNGYEYRTIAHTLRFGPGDRVVRGAPGLAAGDFEAAVSRAAAVGAGSVGAYSLRGGVVDIVWRDGTTTSFAYDAGRGTLSRGQLRLAHVVSPTGYRLDGTYGTQAFTNLSAGAGLPETGVATWRQITFHPDGRFTTAGAAGVATASVQGGGVATDRSAGSGSYRVGDHELELAVTSGERRTVPFWIDVGEARRAIPGWVVVNGTVWLRRSPAP
jgi:hypothetical protein